jgi:transcriptional regulator with XRE-family HTH domain
MPKLAARGRLREARERAGLSQDELARRAKVSRALISAIEHDRHAPAVDAALRLARALGVTAEWLFAPAEEPVAPVSALGAALPDGTPVRAFRVGDRLVASAVRPLVDTADGVIEAGALRLFAQGCDGGTAVLGCDPALAIADALTSRRGSERVVGVPATTGQALKALAGGRCHGALVHGILDRLPEPPLPVARWHFARWRVGVGYHPALGHPSLDVLLEGRTPVVRRPATATSDEAFVRAARRLGLAAPPRGPVAVGHLDAAQHASLARAAAVTFEPAAAVHGLRFEPLETHAVQLWVAEPWRAHPGITSLLEALASRAFQDRVGVQGYDLEHCGREVA